MFCKGKRFSASRGTARAWGVQSPGREAVRGTVEGRSNFFHLLSFVDEQTAGPHKSLDYRCMQVNRLRTPLFQIKRPVLGLKTIVKHIFWKKRNNRRC